MAKTNCEDCMNYEYDEEYDEYRCSVDLDMDEAEAFLSGRNRACPFYRPGDEYTIVKEQN